MLYFCAGTLYFCARLVRCREETGGTHASPATHRNTLGCGRTVTATPTLAHPPCPCWPAPRSLLPRGVPTSRGHCPAHRELLWQEAVPGGSRGTPRLGGRDEAEQRKEPVAGEGGWGSASCPQGQPQRLRKRMVKSP